MAYIIGLNAYHADSSAALVADGKLIAAVDEERFNRIKHWSGFPTESIRYCLNEGKIAPKDIDYICVNRNVRSNILKKISYVINKRPSLSLMKDRLLNRSKICNIADEFCNNIGVNRSELKAKIKFIEHHRSHIASSFLVSPFNESAVVSVDGFGDFLSCMTGVGKNNSFQVLNTISYPHSLGIFYLAITQYLGFPEYGAEYKVMGLAPYGKPQYIHAMEKLVSISNNGLFKLGLEYFRHHNDNLEMSWNNTAPAISSDFTDRLIELLGPARNKGEEITQRHKDIAASLQLMYETAFFALLNGLYAETKMENICIAGGCAMNSVANGKIFQKTPFKNVFIQPAAGDSGGSIGAALYAWNVLMRNKRNFVMEHAYWGPQFSDSEIASELETKKESIIAENCVIKKITDSNELCRHAAKFISQGKVVGWYQGRMEWGPRALGNRSILCDPTRADMKDILNHKIKRRESFRPFAPSILRHAVKDWFETDYDVPFMLQVYQIKPEKRKYVPAITHVDGSGRLQTVTEKQNTLYFTLISEFQKITGIPMLLNTSFNENEPIVCRPHEALDCFLRTKMDALVLGHYMITRN